MSIDVTLWRRLYGKPFRNYYYAISKKRKFRVFGIEEFERRKRKRERENKNKKKREIPKGLVNLCTTYIHVH